MTEEIRQYVTDRSEAYRRGSEDEQAKALFIPTAAIDADAIVVFPKSMNDLLKAGIPKQNVRVFDLHQNMPVDELKAYDVVCLTGGRTSCLPERINTFIAGDSGKIIEYWLRVSA